MESDVPWLCDMVEEEELQVLFSPNQEELQHGVRKLVEWAAQDEAIERKLIDLVETALEYRNDGSEATLWATVVLGEIHSTEALGALLRCLATDDDEALQEVAGIALLRIGPPALEWIMDAADDEAGVTLRRETYRVLGMVGVLNDELMLERVGDYLESRLGGERLLPPGERALEELFQALAELGRRASLEPMRALEQSAEFRSHSGLNDAIERLEENEDGVPFVRNVLPWEERYGWLFEERGAGSSDAEDGGDEEDAFYLGLGAR